MRRARSSAPFATFDTPSSPPARSPRSTTSMPSSPLDRARRTRTRRGQRRRSAGSRDALLDERPRLLPLPEHRFECDLVRPLPPAKLRTCASIAMTIRFRTPSPESPSPSSRPRPPCACSTETPRWRDTRARTIAAGSIEDDAHLGARAEKRHARELRGRDRLHAPLHAAPSRSSPRSRSTAATSAARPRGCSVCSISTAPPRSTTPSPTRT